MLYPEESGISVRSEGFGGCAVPLVLSGPEHLIDKPVFHGFRLKNGASGRSRTDDLIITNDLL